MLGAKEDAGWGGWGYDAGVMKQIDYGKERRRLGELCAKRPQGWKNVMPAGTSGVARMNRLRLRDSDAKEELLCREMEDCGGTDERNQQMAIGGIYGDGSRFAFCPLWERRPRARGMVAERWRKNCEA